MQQTPIVIVRMLALSPLGGCNRILGLEKDYVLREPVQVRLGNERETITVPAGTRVKQIGFKDNVLLVQIYGHASRTQLEAAAESK